MLKLGENKETALQDHELAFSTAVEKALLCAQGSTVEL